jgi:hypothetical protein
VELANQRERYRARRDEELRLQREADLARWRGRLAAKIQKGTGPKKPATVGQQANPTLGKKL